MEIKYARIGVVSVLDAGTDEETAKEVYYWKAECGDQHGLFYSIENAISNAEYNGYTVVKEEQVADLFNQPLTNCNHLTQRQRGPKAAPGGSVVEKESYTRQRIWTDQDDTEN